MAHRHNLSVDECLHNYASHMYHDPKLMSIYHVLRLLRLWEWERKFYSEGDPYLTKKIGRAVYLDLYTTPWLKQPAQLDRPRTVAETAQQTDTSVHTLTTPPRFSGLDDLQFHGYRSMLKVKANLARFTTQTFNRACQQRSHNATK